MDHRRCQFQNFLTTFTIFRYDFFRCVCLLLCLLISQIFIPNMTKTSFPFTLIVDISNIFVTMKKTKYEIVIWLIWCVATDDNAHAKYDVKKNKNWDHDAHKKTLQRNFELQIAQVANRSWTLLRFCFLTFFLFFVAVTHSQIRTQYCTI